MKIETRVGTLEEAQNVHKSIKEFDNDYLTKMLPNIDTGSMIIFIVSADNKDVGYSISYDRWKDGSLYAWMAGVLPEYRGQGCYKALANVRSEYAKANGYTHLKLKTKNRRREMLSFLIKDGWNIIEFVKKDNNLDSNVLFEKEI